MAPTTSGQYSAVRIQVFRGANGHAPRANVGPIRPFTRCECARFRGVMQRRHSEHRMWTGRGTGSLCSSTVRWNLVASACEGWPSLLYQSLKMQKHIGNGHVIATDARDVLGEGSGRLTSKGAGARGARTSGLFLDHDRLRV